MYFAFSCTTPRLPVRSKTTQEYKGNERSRRRTEREALVVVAVDEYSGGTSKRTSATPRGQRQTARVEQCKKEAEPTENCSRYACRRRRRRRARLWGLPRVSATQRSSDAGRWCQPMQEYTGSQEEQRRTVASCQRRRAQ
jgi:hypothetical protein